MEASSSPSNPESKEEKEAPAKREVYKLPATIPIFDRYEIKFGAILGSGAFCTVCSIDNITKNDTLDPSIENMEGDDKQTIEDEQMQQLRRQRLVQKFQEAQFVPQSMIDGSDPEREAPPRYAIKYLKRGLTSSDRKRGMQDLEIELHLLLKCIDHPHIITLFGVGGSSKVDLDGDEATPSTTLISSSSSSSSKDRFLILDRLQSTLQNRFYKWREKRGVGLFEVLAINERENKDLWLQRMVILTKIASAMYFLHKEGIIYRDLKPENIGFDYDNTPKLFDFGLARNLPESSAPTSDDGQDALDENSYLMTGMTGSPRYMAPEVALSRPYGSKADVYSFAILMQEVLSLKVPYATFNGIRKLQYEVIHHGVRPYVDTLWPDSISDLLTEMWHGNQKYRPSSREVLKRLEGVLRGRDDDLFPSWGVKKWFR